jgi:hypothetical protein
MNTKDIGNISEAMILAALVRAGRAVLRPFGDNLRYDLAVDDGGKLVRIQCKTGRIVRDAIEFPTSSSQIHRGKGRQPYHKQADYFGIYCAVTGKCYLISVADVGNGSCRLRIRPTTNGQVCKVRYACDYEIK